MPHHFICHTFHLPELESQAGIDEMAMTAVFAHIVVLLTVLSAVSATINDQPLNGVSEPSKFATSIVPTDDYVPKM